MIDFSFQEEELLLMETATAFATRELRPQARAHEAARSVADEVSRSFLQTGFDQVGEPDSGTSLLARCCTLEALAHGDAGATLSLMRQALIRSVCRALKAPESLVEQISYVQPVESLQGGGDTLAWLPTEAGAGVLLRFESEGRWQASPLEATTTHSLGLLAAGGSRCTVQAPIQQGEAGPEAGRRALALLHSAAAAMLVGISQASLDYAAHYVQERETFGKPLAQHQGIAFLAAEMGIRTEAARLLVYKAAHELDAGDSRIAAAAWLEASEAARWVTDHGVQLLGGHGYMKAHPVEKWMRDARALSLAWGGEDIALEADCAWS